MEMHSLVFHLIQARRDAAGSAVDLHNLNMA